MLTLDPNEVLTPELFARRWNHLKYSYAAHGKNTLRKTARKTAIKRRFIQANNARRKNLITVDLDAPDAEWVLFALTQQGVIPQFSFAIYNPESLHAHVGWFMSGEAANQQQQAWFDDLAKGLTRLLAPYGADEKYTRHSMRNPAWLLADTEWGTAHEWSYAELDEFVKAAPATEAVGGSLRAAAVKGSSTLGKVEPGSQSRNSDLFEAVRGWAYSRYAQSGHEADIFEPELLAALQLKNREFSRPLPEAEVLSVRDSILRFTKKYIKPAAFKKGKRKQATGHEPTAEELSIIQSFFSNRRSVVQEAPRKHAELLALLEEGLSGVQVAEQLGITTAAARKRIQRARLWAVENDSTMESESIQADARTGEVLDTEDNTSSFLINGSVTLSDSTQVQSEEGIAAVQLPFPSPVPYLTLIPTFAEACPRPEKDILLGRSVTTELEKMFLQCA